ncbi:hypothetical protein ACWCQE_08575 [Streptomyces sp. NPDC002409]
MEKELVWSRRMRNALVHGQQSGTDRGRQGPARRSLRLTLDGPPVRDHRIEASVLGGWLTALQTAVTSVARALDDQRPTHDSGPVPGEIQRATKLYSSAVFPSSSSSSGAQRCRETLGAADFAHHSDTLTGTVVGGSKVRKTVEIEVPRCGVVTVRADREVTALLSAYANHTVRAKVLVTTARSPLGREHHSYLLLDPELDDAR